VAVLDRDDPAGSPPFRLDGLFARPTCWPLRNGVIRVVGGACTNIRSWWRQGGRGAKMGPTTGSSSFFREKMSYGGGLVRPRARRWDDFSQLTAATHWGGLPLPNLLADGDGSDNNQPRRRGRTITTTTTFHARCFPDGRRTAKQARDHTLIDPAKKMRGLRPAQPNVILALGQQHQFTCHQFTCCCPNHGRSVSGGENKMFHAPQQVYELDHFYANKMRLVPAECRWKRPIPVWLAALCQSHAICRAQEKIDKITCPNGTPVVSARDFHQGQNAGDEKCTFPLANTLQLLNVGSV
jgi:hypothetical protein